MSAAPVVQLTDAKTRRSPSQASEQVWLSPERVCELLPGMTVVNLAGMRKKGRGPRYYKPTLKTVIYAQSDVDAWVQASVVSTKEQP